MCVKKQGHVTEAAAMGMVVDAFARYVERMFREMIEDVEPEPGMLPGVLGEMDRIHVKLMYLQAFVADRRGIPDRSLQAWVYGFTDIIDIYQLEAMERGSSAADGVGCFNPLLNCKRKYVYAPDIWRLNQMLEVLMEKGRAFSFVNPDSYMDRGGKVRTSSHFSHETPEELNRLGVIGEKIEEATKTLVARILRTREENATSVVAIVGVGGIGKTTLAQKVFNDEAIQGEFDKKIWLRVNKDFDSCELLRTAIVAAGGEPTRANGLVLLHQILRNALRGKKLLLVMDDVWDSTTWGNMLKAPFSYAAQGSRVLITTRDERVARELRAEWPYHHVDKLGSEDAWSLMKRQVTFSEIDEPEIDILKDIGLQMIAKCGGLPLAVKVMGRLLCQRDRQRRDWEMVLNGFSPGHEMPEEINYSMYLSYDEMSPDLKQCFLHYSFLPTDVVFYENDIIGMWISEGFVHGNSEELGRDYYDMLILMNLIERDARYTSQRVCNMNDVVRSFAQFICRDEVLVAHNGEIYDTSYLSSKKFYRLCLKSEGLESDMFVWSLAKTDIIENTSISWPDKA